MTPPPTPLTLLIHQVQSGQRDAKELLPLLYNELRLLAAARLMHESPAHTLQPTALVHEAYLRLLGPSGQTLKWDSRGHFFAAAAEAMRRIIIDHARARQAARRGGGGGGGGGSGGDSPNARTLPLNEASHDVALSLNTDPDLLIDLSAALSALEAEDAPKAQLVKLRFFAGLTLDQAALALNLSPATADRHWAFAKAWLYSRLSPPQQKSPKINAPQ